MTEVLVARLDVLGPGTTIQVLSEAPELVASKCPGTVPLDGVGRRVWLDTALAGGRPVPLLSGRFGTIPAALWHALLFLHYRHIS